MPSLRRCNRVQRTPTAHALWRHGFRRIRLKRYPYIVIYHADRAVTSVLALVHERCEPRRILATMARRLSNFE